MTKKEIALKIAEETGIKQTDTKKVVQKTLDHIITALAAGKTVELRNFGVFDTRLQHARKARNPKKPGVVVHVPPRAVVAFKVGKKMSQEAQRALAQLRS